MVRTFRGVLLTLRRQDGPSQAWGCAALAALAEEAPTRDAVVACGGVEALAAAMRDHPRAAPVQEAACRCLALIVAPTPAGPTTSERGRSWDKKCVSSSVRACRCTEGHFQHFLLSGGGLNFP